MLRIRSLSSRLFLNQYYKQMALQYANEYSPDEMHWIGYLYRYWAYFSGMSSKQIYKIVKPGKLKQLYYPYHSLDPMQAIERIKEETDAAAFDFGNIERGVEILRKIRNRPPHR